MAIRNEQIYNFFLHKTDKEISQCLKNKEIILSKEFSNGKSAANGNENYLTHIKYDATSKNILKVATKLMLTNKNCMEELTWVYTALLF